MLDAGMKLLLDFIPNHTSRKHKWFQSSVNRTAQYKDYYIWHGGIEGQNGTKQPPNNWVDTTFGYCSLHPSYSKIELEIFRIY